MSGIFFQDQARCLVEGGYKVGVVTAEIRRWRELRHNIDLSGLWSVEDGEKQGVRVIRSQQLNVVPRRWRAARWLRQTLWLAERYRRDYGTPDILHAQSTLWGGYAAYILARRWHRPMVVTEHSTAFLRGTVAKWERNWIRMACAPPTIVLAVSPALASSMSAVTGGPVPDVVPNLVDTEFFRPPQSPSPAPFDLLCVAMLEQKKGIDVLLESLARLKKFGRGVRLQVIGDGSERSALETLTNQLGLRRFVTFTGLASRRQVRAAMWNTKAFVLPSRVETFGLVLAEALACGIPVVATRCGGPESFLRMPFGRVVPPDDVDALAEAIAGVLSASQLSSSKEGRDYAVTEFGPSAFRARIENIYHIARVH